MDWVERSDDVNQHAWCLCINFIYIVLTVITFIVSFVGLGFQTMIQHGVYI